MNPPKRDMKALFRDSLDAEDKATQDRFARADIALGNQNLSKTKTPEQPAKKTEERAADTQRGKKHRVAVQKVVRDTFSMPEEDHAMIAQIQEQLVREHALVLNKSEILRAGLHALKNMSETQRLKIAQSVENLKRGRKV